MGFGEVIGQVITVIEQVTSGGNSGKSNETPPEEATPPDPPELQEVADAAIAVVNAAAEAARGAEPHADAIAHGGEGAMTIMFLIMMGYLWAVQEEARVDRKIERQDWSEIKKLKDQFIAAARRLARARRSASEISAAVGQLEQVAHAILRLRPLRPPVRRRRPRRVPPMVRARLDLGLMTLSALNAKSGRSTAAIVRATNIDRLKRMSLRLVSLGR